MFKQYNDLLEEEEKNVSLISLLNAFYLVCRKDPLQAITQMEKFANATREATLGKSQSLLMTPKS